MPHRHPRHCPHQPQIATLSRELRTNHSATVARLAQALGSTVIAYTASPRDTPESRRDNGFIVPGTGDPDGSIPEKWFSGLEKEKLHEFLRQQIDLLVISVPLT